MLKIHLAFFRFMVLYAFNIEFCLQFFYTEMALYFFIFYPLYFNVVQLIEGGGKKIPLLRIQGE